MNGRGSDTPAAVLSFSEAELRSLQNGLFQLLKEQAARINGDDRTSMPVEKAQELLKSLYFTVRAAAESGIGREELLSGDLHHVLLTGQRLLEAKTAAAGLAWKELCRNLPAYGNVYFYDTVRNLSRFFEFYDIESAAHCVPCVIDYWPLIPVPESLEGVCYIEEYLRRLQLENAFLRLFRETAVDRLYEQFAGSGPGRVYEESFFNLCEPVLANACGRVLLGKQPWELNISRSDRQELLEKLAGLTGDATGALIREAVTGICSQAGFTGEKEQAYFRQSAAGLALRLHEAASAGDLTHLFAVF